MPTVCALGLTIRMELGKWSDASRKVYNLNDAVSRCTVQVRVI